MEVSLEDMGRGRKERTVTSPHVSSPNHPGGPSKDITKTPAGFVLSNVTLSFCSYRDSLEMLSDSIYCVFDSGATDRNKFLLPYINVNAYDGTAFKENWL